MAAAGGPDAAGLSERVYARAAGLEFFQAVRLLRRLLPGRAGVGRDADPDEECVRFRSEVSFAFPAADLVSLEPPAAGAPARMTVSFMGVATPASFGSLPSVYAQEILDRDRDEGSALRAFLDLFNHRLVSLFYRAWERAHLAPLYESGDANPFESALLALLGLRTPGLAGRLELEDGALLGRAGLLGMRPTPAAALEGALESVFDLPARVEQLIPAWYDIDPDDRNRLGRAGTRLGEDLFLGARVRLVQSRFRVRLGPMRRARYDALLPGGGEHGALVGLVRLAAGADLDFELQYVLERDDVPALRLESAPERPVRLGWSTWLAAEPPARDADDALFRCDAHSPGRTQTTEVRP